jgi:SAM-dependent methyltransferase
VTLNGKRGERTGASELDFLLEHPALRHRFDDRRLRHLTSPLSLRDYVRVADRTARLVHGKHLLDWGCGYGQVSYLLSRRGLTVTSYEIGPAIEDKSVPVAIGLRAVRGDHPYELPLRECAFDAVVACGVLEHVDDVGRSLAELRRVLVPGGQLFIYNLPQRYSYKEFMIKRLRLGFSHEHRYTRRTICALLQRNGFDVLSVGRAGFLPHMVTGLPPIVRRLYYRAPSTLFAIDRLLSRVPGVNLVAQSLEVVAKSQK